MADADATTALWQWCLSPEKEKRNELTDEDWGCYSEEQNAELEKAFQNGQIMHEVTVGVRTYRVDFQQMKQICGEWKRARTVRRVEGAASPTAAGGEVAGDEENCVLCAQAFEETKHVPTVCLPCNHKYHRACALPLAEAKSRCPLCCREVPWDAVGISAAPQTSGPLDSVRPRTGDPMQELLAAAYHGNAEEVVTLLKQGVPVDTRSARNATPLIMASMQGHMSVVAVVLKARANVHLATSANKTALWVAGAEQRTEVARHLLNARANPSATSEGVAAGRFPVVAELLARAGITLPDEQGAVATK